MRPPPLLLVILVCGVGIVLASPAPPRKYQQVTFPPKLNVVKYGTNARKTASYHALPRGLVSKKGYSPQGNFRKLSYAERFAQERNINSNLAHQNSMACDAAADSPCTMVDDATQQIQVNPTAGQPDIEQQQQSSHQTDGPLNTDSEILEPVIQLDHEQSSSTTTEYINQEHENIFQAVDDHDGASDSLALSDGTAQLETSSQSPSVPEESGAPNLETTQTSHNSDTSDSVVNEASVNNTTTPPKSHKQSRYRTYKISPLNIQRFSGQASKKKVQSKAHANQNIVDTQQKFLQQQEAKLQSKNSIDTAVIDNLASSTIENPIICDCEPDMTQIVTDEQSLNLVNMAEAENDVEPVENIPTDNGLSEVSVPKSSAPARPPRAKNQRKKGSTNKSKVDTPPQEILEFENDTSATNNLDSSTLAVLPDVADPVSTGEIEGETQLDTEAPVQNEELGTVADVVNAESSVQPPNPARNAKPCYSCMKCRAGKNMKHRVSQMARTFSQPRTLSTENFGNNRKKRLNKTPQVQNIGGLNIIKVC